MNLQKKLKIHTIDSLNTLLLSASHRGPKLISGIYNYDILTNPVYQNAFFYTSIEKRNLEFLKSTSELVERLLYLGETDGCEQDFHKKELIHQLIEVGSKQEDMLMGINADKTDGGLWQALQEDLEIEIDIEGD